MNNWNDDYYEEEEETEIMAETATETPQGLNITLTIAPHDIRGIENAVVASIARSFEKRIEHAVDKLIAQKTQEAVQTLAESKVAEYIARPRQKTNSYGEPVGEPVTPLEILMKQFAEYMQQKVDSDGRSGYSNSKMSREDWLIQKLGIAPLQQAVADEVTRISGRAKEEIKKTVSGYIAQLLAPDLSVPAIAAPQKA